MLEVADNAAPCYNGCMSYEATSNIKTTKGNKMDKQEIIDRLVNLYKLIEKDLGAFEDEASKRALLDQRFGVRMTAQALQVWDEVLERVSK